MEQNSQPKPGFIYLPPDYPPPYLWLFFLDNTAWETVRKKFFCSDFTILMGDGTACVFQKTSVGFLFNLSFDLFYWG